MDKIVKKCDTSTTSEQPPAPSITQQPKGQTSKSVMDRVFDFLQLGEGERRAGAAFAHNSKFKVNDRVILQSVKEEVIAGTVRWVGPVKFPKEMNVDLVSVVGVETVSEVV